MQIGESEGQVDCEGDGQPEVAIQHEDQLHDDHQGSLLRGNRQPCGKRGHQKLSLQLLDLVHPDLAEFVEVAAFKRVHLDEFDHAEDFDFGFDSDAGLVFELLLGSCKGASQAEPYRDHQDEANDADQAAQPAEVHDEPGQKHNVEGSLNHGHALAGIGEQLLALNVHDLGHLADGDALVGQDGALERLPDQGLRHEPVHLEADRMQPPVRELGQEGPQHRDYYYGEDEVQVGKALVGALGDVDENVVGQHCDADMQHDLQVVGQVRALQLFCICRAVPLKLSFSDACSGSLLPSASSAR